MPKKPVRPPATVIQPMRWSRFSASTSAMPSTGKGLNASMQRKPSARARVAASSSASSVPNSPIYPRSRSGTCGLLLAREHFLVFEDRDRRKEADEQQERRQEQPEHSDIGAPVPEARMIIAERGGE